MTKLLTFAVLLAIILSVNPSVLAAPVIPILPVIVKDAVYYQNQIKEIAIEYGVSSIEMLAVVSCETAGTFRPDIQSFSRYPDGTREKSFGLAQIHLPAHPNITREQAIDPDFALRFMATEFKKGKKGAWSCYTILKNKGLI